MLGIAVHSSTGRDLFPCITVHPKATPCIVSMTSPAVEPHSTWSVTVQLDRKILLFGSKV